MLQQPLVDTPGEEVNTKGNILRWPYWFDDPVFMQSLYLCRELLGNVAASSPQSRDFIYNAFPIGKLPLLQLHPNRRRGLCSAEFVVFILLICHIIY